MRHNFRCCKSRVKFHQHSEMKAQVLSVLQGFEHIFLFFIYIFIFYNILPSCTALFHFIWMGMSCITLENPNWYTEKGIRPCLCICRPHFTSGTIGLQKWEAQCFTCSGHVQIKNFVFYKNMWQNFKAIKSSALSESSIIDVILYIVI